MKCLRCENTELEIKVRGEGSDIIEIDICPNCGGIWLDAQELEQLDDNFFLNLEKTEYQLVKPTSDDKLIQCPRCEGNPVMNKVRPHGYNSVVIDTCPKCSGFWLDKDELCKLKDVSDKLLIASLLSLDE